MFVEIRSATSACPPYRGSMVHCIGSIIDMPRRGVGFRGSLSQTADKGNRQLMLVGKVSHIVTATK